jgi:signal transduction histidine kinase
MVVSPPRPSPRLLRAHALKNCLSVIYAVTRLVEDDVAERSRPRLEKVFEAVRRMKELIEQDLRPPAQQATALVPVGEILRQVRARVEDHAATRHVELVVESGRGEVHGDVESLVEALVDIVTNAIHASADGGLVSIATHETVDGDQQWTVADAGCGMNAKELVRFGQPFVSTFEGGSGVGVAAARDVINRHGGILQADSMPSVGTVVTIWLPRDDA